MPTWQLPIFCSIYKNSLFLNGVSLHFTINFEMQIANFIEL